MTLEQDRLDTLLGEILKIISLQDMLQQNLHIDKPLQSSHELVIIFIELMQINKATVEDLLTGDIGQSRISYLESLAAREDFPKICKLIYSSSSNDKLLLDNEEFFELWWTSFYLQEKLDDLFFTVRAKIAEYGLGLDSEVSFLNLDSLFNNTIDRDRLSVIEKRITYRIFGRWEYDELKKENLYPISNIEADGGPFFPTRFYKKYTLISENNLAQAAHKGKIRYKKVGRLNHYSLIDAKKLWPDWFSKPLSVE